jgi:hypothetical protein
MHAGIAVIVTLVLICRDCDTVYRTVPLQRGEVALDRIVFLARA